MPSRLDLDVATDNMAGREAAATLSAEFVSVNELPCSEDRILEKIKLVRDYKLLREQGKQLPLANEVSTERHNSDGAAPHHDPEPPRMPVHPREVSRKLAEFQESISDVIEAYCPSLSNLNNLIKAWHENMKKFVSVMKIGFSIGSGRVTLSKDGGHLIFELQNDAAVKVPLTSLVNAELEHIANDGGLAGEGGDGGGSLGLTIAFSEGGQTHKLGPLRPTTDLELMCWYLVIAMQTTSKGNDAYKTKSNNQVQFRRCLIMILAELGKTVPFCEAFRLLERKLCN